MSTPRLSASQASPLAKRRVQGNLLLASVPFKDRRRLTAGCECVDLRFGEILCEQGDPISHVYFPAGSVISLLCSLPEERDVEVGIVGAEGVLGVSLVFGIKVATLRAVVQVAGGALRMPAAEFSREFERTPALKEALNSYLHALLSQLAQSAACARFHQIKARLAGCLLMTRDRVRSNGFYLTHEFIAGLMGVRRVTITTAASSLQKEKVIRYVRGHVTVLDADALETVSCGCYAAYKHMHRHLTNGGRRRLGGVRLRPASESSLGAAAARKFKTRRRSIP
jgi:CRP-like cAMP-binding protein